MTLRTWIAVHKTRGTDLLGTICVARKTAGIAVGTEPPTEAPGECDYDGPKVEWVEVQIKELPKCPTCGQPRP